MGREDSECKDKKNRMNHRPRTYRYGLPETRFSLVQTLRSIYVTEPGISGCPLGAGDCTSSLSDCPRMLLTDCVHSVYSEE
jgi:hypothetical protein